MTYFVLEPEGTGGFWSATTYFLDQNHTVVDRLLPLLEQILEDNGPKRRAPAPARRPR